MQFYECNGTRCLNDYDKSRLSVHSSALFVDNEKFHYKGLCVKAFYVKHFKSQKSFL